MQSLTALYASPARSCSDLPSNVTSSEVRTMDFGLFARRSPVGKSDVFFLRFIFTVPESEYEDLGG